MTTTDLVQSIDDRLAQLAAQITVLETAREELLSGNGTAPRRSGNGTAPRLSGNGAAPRRNATTVPRRRRAAPKPSAEVLPAGKLEAMLAEHDGITSTAVARLANAAREQVLTLLRELEAAGRARRTGQRRGTRWHAITDADRIAARVAELEKLSNGRGSAARKARLEKRLKPA
jgi:hypothetical protein